MRGARGPWAIGLVAAAVAVTQAGPVRLAAQTLEGRILDEAGNTPVSAALVRVVDEAGEAVLQAESDSLGRYRLELPDPGSYRLLAERLGYEPLATPLLDLSFEGSRALDLVMKPVPLSLRGFEVTAGSVASSEESLEVALRHFGVMPGEVTRTRLVTSAEIEAITMVRDFGDVLQWQNIPGLSIHRDARTDELTCVEVRARAGCATIVIDGLPVSLEQASLLPKEAWEAMVVLVPHQAGLLYGTSRGGGGAVLLFRKGGVLR